MQFLDIYYISYYLNHKIEGKNKLNRMSFLFHSYSNIKIIDRAKYILLIEKYPLHMRKKVQSYILKIRIICIWRYFLASLYPDLALCFVFDETMLPHSLSSNVAESDQSNYSWK